MAFHGCPIAHSVGYWLKNVLKNLSLVRAALTSALRRVTACKEKTDKAACSFSMKIRGGKEKSRRALALIVTF